MTKMDSNADSNEARGVPEPGNLSEAIMCDLFGGKRQATVPMYPAGDSKGSILPTITWSNNDEPLSSQWRDEAPLSAAQLLDPWNTAPHTLRQALKLFAAMKTDDRRPESERPSTTSLTVVGWIQQGVIDALRGGDIPLPKASRKE